ncbi:CheY-like chemotaxis protein [Pedobacter cryoconitis]|uniref:CheY-like chemotaxis protein n=1 Tax=Pedobacter cryoconitis TaxID=188932 RepID=A0A7W8ZQJ9_9SPHI|nr:response regulator [Pedobacter cryoconitis]MBB5638371.1 CheY-like chemotaxis protein [Pedobacter cryoconitis]
MNEKILIIEDHDAIRGNIVEILEMAKYTVFEADNGKMGLEMALKHIPDIILCDIMMPELDGYGVLYMLNKYSETSAIPFIFLTAKADHHDLRKGMEMGADDYLTKPFDDIELLNAIEVRLRKKAHLQLQNKNTADEFKVLVAKTDGLAEFSKIIAGHKGREFRKNQVVYYEGDHGKGLYLIIQGKIKTIKLSLDGRELMTGMYTTGGYLGINTILGKSNYTDTATAIEDSTLCLIPVEELEKVINLYPEVARKFIHLLSNDNREKEEQLLQLAYDSVRKKMAGAILRLYHQQIIKSDFLSITREDLAAMACMATETVSRTLSDFRNEKLIEREGITIMVLDVERLTKMKN